MPYFYLIKKATIPVLCTLVVVLLPLSILNSGAHFKAFATPTALLEDARLPFEGTMRYTSGPHGVTTSACTLVNVDLASGIDFARKESTDNANFNVLNIQDGVLLSADTNVGGGIGNRVRIKHSEDLVSEYWHLDTISSEIHALSVDDPVPQGFLIGTAGDSGGQAAVHLHLELRTPSGDPVSWDGQEIGGYKIGMHKDISDNSQGYNYQGSAVIGTTNELEIDAYCGGSTDNLALVGEEFVGDEEENGVDPNTIFASTAYGSTAGFLTSNNVIPQNFIKYYRTSTSNNDSSNSIIQTTDGGYILTAMSDNYAGTLLKLDNTGGIEWYKSYGALVNDIYELSSGDFIVAGHKNPSGSSMPDAWLMKIESDGDIIWEKTYGGARYDYAISVIPTSDGGYIFTGDTNSPSGGGADVWIVKTDASGTLSWNIAYGGSYADKGVDIIESSSGGYIVAGSFTSNNGSDALLFKINSTGTVLWKNIYRNTASSTQDYATKVIELSDGTYAAVGNIGLDSWLAVVNDSGTTLMQKIYPGGASGTFNTVAESHDGEILLGGHTYAFGAGSSDVWIAKADLSNGSLIWQKTYGGTGTDQAMEGVLTSDRGFVVAGRTTSYATKSDIWVLKVDKDGAVGNSCTLGASSSASVSSPTGNIANTNLSTRVITASIATPSTTPSNVSLSDAVQCSE